MQIDIYALFNFYSVLLVANLICQKLELKTNINIHKETHTPTYNLSNTHIYIHIFA